MAVDALGAAKAYQNQMKMMQDAPPSQEETGGPSFAQLINEALSEAAQSENKSEALQMQSLTTGKVDLTDLVTAVANAELSLNTVVSIRDRVINAYQDIIKMPV
jgi:flagellar hook-basal body complex protein FliE